MKIEELDTPFFGTHLRQAESNIRDAIRSVEYLEWDGRVMQHGLRDQVRPELRRRYAGELDRLESALRLLRETLANEAPRPE